MPNWITCLNRTPNICIVCDFVGSRDKYQKDVRSKEIGLNDEITITTLNSIGSIIGLFNEHNNLNP